MSFNFNEYGLGKVLEALKNNIMRNTHVATFAIVKEKNSDNAVYVDFIPKTTNENISNVLVYNASPFELEVNDMVLVLFMDKNFKMNVEQYLNNNKMSDMSNSELHSINFGVIITKYNGKFTDKDTYPVSWSSSYSNEKLTQTITMNNGDTISNTVTINGSGSSAVTSVNGKTGDVILSISDLENVPTVAITGDYNDLINRPTYFGYTVQNDILTPAIQSSEPAGYEHPMWYKINNEDANNLLSNESSDIIYIEEVEEDFLLRN